MPDFAVGIGFNAKETVVKAFKKMDRSAEKFGRSSPRAFSDSSKKAQQFKNKQVKVSGKFGGMTTKARLFGVEADSAFRRAGRSASLFGNILKFGVQAGLLAIAGALITIAIGVKRAFFGFITEASKVENATAEFKTLTGSMEKAVDTVEKLRKTASTTPFEFGDLASVTKLLLGFEAATLNNVIPTLRMLGDTAQGSGDKFQGIALAFSQIVAGGKANMQDINQLINNNIPIFSALKKVTGASIAEIRDMVSAGKITSSVIIKAFKQMTSEGGKFFKGMEEASKTLTGKFSTLKDNVKITAATIGAALLPELKKGTDFLTNLAVRANAWAQANQELIKQKFGKFVGFFKDIWKQNKAIIKQKFFEAIDLMRDAWKQSLPILVDFIRVLKNSGPVFKLLAALTIGLGVLTIELVKLINKIPFEAIIAKTQDFGKALRQWVDNAKRNLFTMADVFLSTFGTVISLILKASSTLRKFSGQNTDSLDETIRKLDELKGAAKRGRFGIEEVALTRSGKTQPTGVGGKLPRSGSRLNFGPLPSVQKINFDNNQAPNRRPEAPNKGQAAQRIDFNGRLQIAGAPKGSTFDSNTQGAPPVEVVGVNP